MRHAGAFFKRDDRLFVRTDGRDSRLAEFEIQYTLGVYRCNSTSLPFQMAEYSRSRSWDARAKKDGGQRLFHLYPTELVTHDVELHWTRPAQDWNLMCADCHSTGIWKNYDPSADRFSTRWAQINVSCEACHGLWFDKSPSAHHRQQFKRLESIVKGNFATRSSRTFERGMLEIAMETEHAAASDVSRPRAQRLPKLTAGCDQRSTSGVGRGAIRDYDVGMGHACGPLMPVLEDPNGFPTPTWRCWGPRCLPNAR